MKDFKPGDRIAAYLAMGTRHVGKIVEVAENNKAVYFECDTCFTGKPHEVRERHIANPKQCRKLRSKIQSKFRPGDRVRVCWYDGVFDGNVIGIATFQLARERKMLPGCVFVKFDGGNMKWAHPRQVKKLKDV